MQLTYNKNLFNVSIIEAWENSLSDGVMTDYIIEFQENKEKQRFMRCYKRNQDKTRLFMLDKQVHIDAYFYGVTRTNQVKIHAIIPKLTTLPESKEPPF